MPVKRALSIHQNDASLAAVPKPHTKKPRRIGGMSVAELKSQDFAAMRPTQLGESLRKSAVKKRK